MTLEEVIAAALESFDYIDVSDAHADAEEYEQITGTVAAAVREWCLAEPQIDVAASAIASLVKYQTVWPIDRDRARAALQAVMGDTP